MELSLALVLGSFLGMGRKVRWALCPERKLARAPPILIKMLPTQFPRDMGRGHQPYPRGFLCQMHCRLRRSCLMWKKDTLMPISPVLLSGSVFLPLKQCPIHQAQSQPLVHSEPAVTLWHPHVISCVPHTSGGGHHLPLLQIRKLRL